MATILVVDDDKTIRQLLRHILVDKGHTVIEADDGDRAVHMIGVRKIDLCIMDIVMRRKGGLEAAQEIRLQNNECGIVLMSGIASVLSEEFQHRLDELGVRCCLAKPFTQTQVAEAVEATLGR